MLQKCVSGWLGRQKKRQTYLIPSLTQTTVTTCVFISGPRAGEKPFLLVLICTDIKNTCKSEHLSPHLLPESARIYFFFRNLHHRDRTQGQTHYSDVPCVTVSHAKVLSTQR